MSVLVHLTLAMFNHAMIRKKQNKKNGSELGQAQAKLKLELSLGDQQLNFEGNSRAFCRD